MTDREEEEKEEEEEEEEEEEKERESGTTFIIGQRNTNTFHLLNLLAPELFFFFNFSTPCI
jgi:hypothetical protein